MIMSTIPMTAATVPHSTSGAAAPTKGLLERAFAALSRYQARVARAYVDQQLKRFSDEELKDMGYGGLDVARIRAASVNVPQHFV